MYCSKWDNIANINTTNKTPNTGLTIITYYNASGGDDSMSIEDVTDIGTIVISLDNLAGYTECKV